MNNHAAQSSIVIHFVAKNSQRTTRNAYDKSGEKQND